MVGCPDPPEPDCPYVEFGALSTAEIYADGSWSAAGSMTDARQNHLATVLPTETSWWWVAKALKALKAISRQLNGIPRNRDSTMTGGRFLQM